MKVRHLVGIIIFILLVLIGSGFFLFSYEDRGTFGDMFGAANSLFSGLAFAALIYTISLQKNELGLQREELSLTRGELREQKEIMEMQVSNMMVQGFEGTFFQMLRLHSDILNSLDLVIDYNAGTQVTGRDCFSDIHEDLISHQCRSKLYKRVFFRGVDDEERFIEYSIDDRKQLKIEAFEEVWKRRNGELGIYFRSLYTLIKFVDQSNINNKKHYTNIVRSQLSEQELSVLIYNCLWLKDSKFTPLVKKYDLLKHIHINKDLLYEG